MNRTGVIVVAVMDGLHAVWQATGSIASIKQRTQ